ncbi:four helix bundle protein [Gilliamella sp. Gris1-4]|uniref:four helix bundle protein n=1 Tax=Gilliamella sp. Gris1-4 TaxID=3120244 RepID=UPI00080E726B|nr:four helix bundle protein [Gilliamella apicola]OCG38415.1 hypothetical protein A9G31_02085 [Gilliamella apicola]OCG65679.1 hypothetical protein A9G39_08465 [Gilliamella apicola]
MHNKLTNPTQSTFVQPKIFNDLVTLYQCYWQTHCHLPKSFKFTTGEAILTELTEAIRFAVLSNIVDRDNIEECQSAVKQLQLIRASLDVIKGLLCVGWKMKMISHGAFASFNQSIDNIQKQTTGWQRWFMAQVDDEDLSQVK